MDMEMTHDPAIETHYSASPTLSKLAEALCKAQSQMSFAVKDNVNPHFNSRYADLASVWECIRKPLTDNGLCIIQPVSSERNTVRVTTLLLHISGEYISETLTITAHQATAQAIGSAITYGRRYGLCGMVGVAQADDDGNAATGAPTHDVVVPKPRPANSVTECAKEIAKLAKTIGFSKEHLSEWVNASVGAKFADLTEDEAQKCLAEWKQIERLYREMVRICKTRGRSPDDANRYVLSWVAESAVQTEFEKPWLAPASVWETWLKRFEEESHNEQ